MYNLSNLKKLRIDSTDLTSGLEYLPNSLTEFSCELTKFNEELNKYQGFFEDNFEENYDFILLKRWRNDHSELITKAKIFTDFENKLIEKEETIQTKQLKIKELKAQLELTKQQKILLEKLEKEKLQLETELENLKERITEFLNGELDIKLKVKEKELNKLKVKFQKEEFVVEDLLTAVDYLASTDLSSEMDRYLEQREKSINRLKSRKFKEDEINKLCDLQQEVTRIKLYLNEWSKELKNNSKLLLECGKELVASLTDDDKNLSVVINKYQYQCIEAGGSVEIQRYEPVITHY